MELEKGLVSGSMSLLVLKLLEDGDLYGYQMIDELRRRSKDAFRLKAGTLYPLLHSLREKENAWNAYAQAVGRVLKGGACVAGA